MNQSFLSFVLVIIISFIFIQGANAYSVVGNKIKDPNGNFVLLRGVDRPSLEWQKDGQYLNKNDYSLMVNKWKANVVRVSLNQDWYLADTTYQATVQTQVDQIVSLGVGVILDLHWNKGGQQNMADADSITFWSQMATKFKNNPWVIFELYNEPHDVSWSDWLNGAGGMQKLYNAIRAAGSDNVVIANGLNWAFDLSGVSSGYALTGTNIAYGSHPYDYAGKQAGDWDKAFGNLAATYPVVLTEFGQYCSQNTYVSDLLSYAQKKGIHWTAWAWWVQDCSFPSIISDWNGTPTSPVGQIVFNYLTSGATPSTPAPSTSSKSSSTSTSTSAKSSTSTSSSSSSSSSSTTKISSSTTKVSSSTTGSGSTGAVTVVYGNSGVTSPFQDYSWADSKNAADTAKFYSGSFSYSFIPKSYQAIYFYNPGGVDTSKHSAITFWVNGGTGGGQKVSVVLVRNSGSTSTITGPDGDDASVAKYIGQSSIPANTWVKGTVPLDSRFPSGTYDGIWFQDKGNSAPSTLYIDDVSLVGK